MYFFQAICSKLFYKLEDFQYSEYIQFMETYPIFGKFSNSFIQNVKLLYSVMQSDGNSFREMSSRTSLTKHLEMKTTF